MTGSKQARSPSTWSPRGTGVEGDGAAITEPRRPKIAAVVKNFIVVEGIRGVGSEWAQKNV